MCGIRSRIREDDPQDDLVSGLHISLVTCQSDMTRHRPCAFDSTFDTFLSPSCPFLTNHGRLGVASSVSVSAEEPGTVRLQGGGEQEVFLFETVSRDLCLTAWRIAEVIPAGIETN